LEGERPEKEQRSGELPDVMWRRESLLKQLKCPSCGEGRMPETEYCVRCGTKLPEVRREESAEVIEQKRLRSRGINLVVDLVPGLASLKTVVTILFVFGLAAANAAVAFSVMFMLATLFGFFAILLYLTGLVWLLHGKVCNPIEAMADFRLRHWLLLIALTVAGARLVPLVF